MKNNRVTKVLHGHRKLLLLLLLLGVTVILSGCYVDPDRQIDDTDGLTIGTQGQDFDIVITTPPPATPAPTATVAAQQYDWSQWGFLCGPGDQPTVRRRTADRCRRDLRRPAPRKRALHPPPRPPSRTPPPITRC